MNLFRYDPKTGEVKTVADIGKALGEDGTKNIPQGKVHGDIFEHDGKLWFGTHVGLYERGGTKDHGPYPGGHFLSYDLKTGAFHDLGIGEPEEGLVTVAMDQERGRLYALTWPSAIFLYVDIQTNRKKTFGPAVVGHSYVNTVETGGVPRSLAVDPRDGNARRLLIPAGHAQKMTERCATALLPEGDGLAAVRLAVHAARGVQVRHVVRDDIHAHPLGVETTRGDAKTVEQAHCIASLPRPRPLGRLCDR